MTESAMQTAVSNGLLVASTALSSMTKMRVQLSTRGWRSVPLGDIPNLSGGPEALVVATYMRFQGDVVGHAVFVFAPEIADFLADAILGEGGEPEMRASALCELSNVAGSSVLNQLADGIRVAILPTPPTLVRDMAGAILQAVAISSASDGLQVVVLETAIAINEDPYCGYFFIVPDQRLDGIRLGMLAYE